MLDIKERGSLTREDRSYTIADLEVREAEDGTVKFEGIASSVDHPYTVRDAFGEFTETMSRGTFAKTLKEKDDVRLLVNHEGVPLARTKSKTLSLSADPHLRAVAPSLDPANPTVQELRSALGRGDIDQMSIGFRVTRQEWNEDYSERTIREVQLFDVSVVTYPANPATSASLRSFDDLMRAITADDCDEEELRRLIAHAESLLPPAQAPSFVTLTPTDGIHLSSSSSTISGIRQAAEVPAMHPELVDRLMAAKKREAAWRAEGLLAPR